MSLTVVKQGGIEVLAEDIDEVVFPFIAEFIPWHDREYGTKLKLDDFHTYEFTEPLGISVKETVHRVHSFIDQEHGHKHVGPIEKSVEANKRLKERFRIKPVTARHPMFHLITKEYLETYFEDTFEEITLIGHAATMDQLRTKAEVCLEIGAVALIDDSIGHVTGCVEVGVGGVLFGDYPWNQSDILHPDIVRCEDWDKVTEHFNV